MRPRLSGASLAAALFFLVACWTARAAVPESPLAQASAEQEQQAQPQTPVAGARAHRAIKMVAALPVVAPVPRPAIARALPTRPPEGAAPGAQRPAPTTRGPPLG